MQLAMLPLTYLCLSFMSFITFTSIPDSVSSAKESLTSSSSSIYEILEAHGLPMGLLPKGVKEFDIDETGRFQVHLDQACSANFKSSLHYDRNVSGTLTFGQIGSLSGILSQELFLWFPVKAIRVDIPSSGLIYFDVGVVYKQFSLSLFETPPDCLAARTVEPEFGKLGYQSDQEDFAEIVTERLSVQSADA